MVTGMMVTVLVRNRIATQEPNFRICHAILTLNHGAWYQDQHTRGKIYVIFASQNVHYEFIIKLLESKMSSLTIVINK